MLTDAGYALATKLFVKLVKPVTDEEKQASYQNGYDSYYEALERRRRVFGR
jgi:hypothetical protein